VVPTKGKGRAAGDLDSLKTIYMCLIVFLKGFKLRQLHNNISEVLLL
jgi:hypothetical protein